MLSMRLEFPSQTWVFVRQIVRHCGLENSPHGQRHLCEILSQVSVVHHRFAFAPGDDVDRELTGRKRDHIVRSGIETVRLADVLLILVDELNILSVRSLAVENNADEIDADWSGVLEENIKPGIRFPFV